MLFNEIIYVYTEKHTKLINTKRRATIFKAGYAYIYHWALKG
jgi:hypothetical protein